MRLSEIRPGDVDRLQHVALMRLTLRVMGETHRILGDLQQWLAGEVRGRAADDGAVGVAELAGLSNQMESRWRQAMQEWRRLFEAALVQAGSLPFGALVVQHNHFMGLVQPLPASTSSAIGEGAFGRWGELVEDFSPAEVGTIINRWQDRRARALQAASERTMPDRLTLSQRVWRLENGGLQQIQGTLAGAYAERTNAYDLAARLEAQLGANQDLPRWTSTRLYRMTPTDRMNDERGLLRGEENRGRGIAYNALRLARTEIQYANVYNHIEIARHTPWTTGKKVRLSPQHPVSDVCDGLAEGGPYAVQDVIIPAHPNCLCYEEYVVMEDKLFAQQVRGWLDGSNTFLDDYQGWLGSIQPSESMPWAMTIADSLELWMNMSGDGHAAALRLGGRTGGEEPGPPPSPPVTPRQTPGGQPARPQGQLPLQPVQAPIKTAAEVRQALLAKAAEYETAFDKAKADYGGQGPAIRTMFKEQERLLAASKKAASEQERLAILKQYDDLDRQIRQIQDERRRQIQQTVGDIKTERSETLRKMLHVDNPARNTISILDPTEVGNAAHWQKGMDEFNKLVSADVWSGNQVGFMAIPDGERPFYNPATGNVRVQAAEPLRAIVHEIGHGFEVRGGLYDKAKTYYDKRTQGETLEKLGTVTGNNNFSDDELTRKDKWMNPYMGKQYASKSTEIVSMGVEYFYAEPEKLAQHDPETFDFIYNLLRGR